jgi:hypothetical protein
MPDLKMSIKSYHDSLQVILSPGVKQSLQEVTHLPAYGANV